LETPYFVFIHRPGPHWLPGKPILAQPLEAHFAYMERLEGLGKLVLGGGFLDNAGAMGILECKNLEEAEALCQADPAVRAQIVIVEVHPYFVTVNPFPNQGTL
jgi:uncharacterized protein YciI